MTQPISIRPERVARLIQKGIAEIITRELEEPQFGLITIHDVTITSDLREARIFYSTFGTVEQIRESRLAIERLIPQIRHLLGQRVRLRYTPNLSFIYDETPEKAERIETIFRRLHEEENK